MALSSEVVDLGEAGPDHWWADRDLAAVRLSAGVAGYLNSASYDEVSDVRTDPFDNSLTRRGAGGDVSAAPAEQGFGTAQSSGPGTQALSWDLEPGSQTAAVMNVDGSPGAAVNLSAGGHSAGALPPGRRDPGRAHSISTKSARSSSGAV